MTPLRTTILLAFFWASLSDAADDEKKTVPLFSSNDMLEVTIRAPFTSIMRVRSLDEEQPATLTYNDPEAGVVSVDLEIRTRGRFRHQKEVCPWAPLRLDFKKSTTKDTLFAGSDKIKMVTHCRAGSTPNTQALLKEHLAYRIYNQVTDNSFRVRLLRVTYVDTDRNDRKRTYFAFLIEHRDQLSDRIGIPINEAEATEIKFLEPAQTNLGSVFQYLIANTDFSPIRAAPGETCCHNNVLFGDQDGELQVIPYDFDMSGIVNASYARPDSSLNISRVMTRLYRGFCTDPEILHEALNDISSREKDVLGIISSLPVLTDKEKQKKISYLESFFRKAEDQDKMISLFEKACHP